MVHSTGSIPWRRRVQAGMAMLALWGGGAALADSGPARANVLNFGTEASAEVVKDWLTITLTATREGSDAAAVQAPLKQAVDAALAEARRQVQAGALEVRTGTFNVSPRYGREGRITGWVGSAEVVLEGRDTARVAALAGRLSHLAITQAGYSLSRELREKHEAELAAEAIRKFRQRAAEMAQQFGFGGYSLVEVTVQGGAQDDGRPRPYVTMKAATAAADAAPVPTEPGRGLLTATVQGSVQLTPR